MSIDQDGNIKAKTAIATSTTGTATAACIPGDDIAPLDSLCRSLVELLAALEATALDELAGVEAVLVTADVNEAVAADGLDDGLELCAGVVDVAKVVGCVLVLVPELALIFAPVLALALAVVLALLLPDLIIEASADDFEAKEDDSSGESDVPKELSMLSLTVENKDPRVFVSTPAV